MIERGCLADGGEMQFYASYKINTSKPHKKFRLGRHCKVCKKKHSSGDNTSDKTKFKAEHIK